MVKKSKKVITIPDAEIEVLAPYVSQDPNQFKLFLNYNPHLEKTPAPRPTFHTLDKKALYRNLAEELTLSFNDGSEVDDIIEDVKDVFSTQSSFNEDGYDLAKKFDKKGYHIDSEIVEVLAGVWHHLGDAQSKANREWVKTYDIKALFDNGALIKTPRGDFGYVRKYYEDEAKIGVQIGDNPNSLHMYNQELCTLKS